MESSDCTQEREPSMYNNEREREGGGNGLQSSFLLIGEIVGIGRGSLYRKGSHQHEKMKIILSKRLRSQPRHTVH